MLKTILLIPPVTRYERMGAVAGGGAVMPGLGVLYIAASMRKAGLDVEIVDAERAGWSRERAARAIVDKRPDILGITTTTLSITATSATTKSGAEEKCFLRGFIVTALSEKTAFGCLLGNKKAMFCWVRISSSQCHQSLGQVDDFSRQPPATH